MEVKILNIEDIETHRQEWERMLLSRDFPSPFCSLDLLLPWIRCFGHSYSLLTLGFFKDGIAKGFMPLVINKKEGLVETRSLIFCGSAELHSDHLDIISSEEDSDRCFEALWSFLADRKLHWDILKFSLISKESRIMRQITGSSNLEWELKERSTAPFIDLGEGFDKYFSNFNGKHRYTLRKKVNKLAEQGYIYTACNHDQIGEGIESLYRLHSLRATNKGIESTFNGERLLALHKTAAGNFSSNGRLWLRFLERDGKKIGAFYGFELGGRLFYYQFGLDPEWEPFSPGTVLMYKVIEETFTRKLKEFDFLRGNESYKYGWTKSERPLYSAVTYRKTLRGAISRSVADSKSYITKSFKRIAGKK